MSIELRTRRLQQCLNAVHGANIAEDGRLGIDTLGAVEKALDVEAWARPAASQIATKFDARTERNLATLDKQARPELRKLVDVAQRVATEHDVSVKVISAHRTWEEQDRLYAQGRTAPGKIVTNARGGYSNHNFGIAIDLGVFRGRAYLDGAGNSTDKQLARRVHKQIAEAAEARQLATEWGGSWRRFPDYPHHELVTGMSLAQKRKAYLENGTVLG